MVRYSFDADTWDILAPVPGDGYHHLVVVAGELYAISASDETRAADYRYKESSDTWVALAAPPMPPVFDRFAVDVGGTLVLYGSPVDGDVQEKLVAAFDPSSDAWTELGAAPSRGWQVFDIDETIVLNPHFSAASGGLHDPVENTWSPLPEEPDSDTWRGDIAGVIGEEAAAYQYGEGWMLDLRSGTWIEVAAPTNSTSGATVVAMGSRLAVVGGHHWTDDELRIDGGLRIWTPPPS